MLLFSCHTLLQLINAINVKINLYPNEQADVVLTDHTNFSLCEEALRKTGVFDEVIHLNWGKQDWQFSESKAENTRIMQNAKEHKFALKNGKKYDHIFNCVLSDSLCFLFYYQMIQEGIIPTVHLVEDGLVHYWTDYIMDGNIDHSVFPARSRITNNVIESLMYEPSLFSGNSSILCHNQMPKSPEQLAKLIPHLYEIFGKPELPEEKYIYFDEAYSFDGNNNNDCDILDYIASIVGKENIIVKIHPRSSENNSYSIRGYKTFLVKDIPWEVFLTLEGIQNKVLLSVSSTSVIAPFTIFSAKTYSILLYKIALNLRPIMKRCESSAYVFYDKLSKYANADNKQLFIPNTMSELGCYIKYLEGEME